MTDFPEHPFWDFSIKVYMSDGVGAACIALQETHGIDVNVLLYCSWLGASGRGVVSDAEMSSITDAVTTWHDDVVRRLRQVRTRMKGGMPPAPDDLSESLRQRIQKIEIDCEHAEQLMLAATIDRAPDETLPAATRAAAAIANISLYFGAAGRELTAEDRGNLAIILAPAFGELTPAELGELCAGV